MYPQVDAACRLMERRQIPRPVIQQFSAMLTEVIQGQKSYVPLDTVSSPDQSLLLDPHDMASSLDRFSRLGAELLGKVVVIKLNGGRSTTMGGEVPKGILTAKNGLSYLDIVLGQMKAVEKRWGVHVPLALMNSFFTHQATEQLLRTKDFPVITFLQNSVPRIAADTFMPLQTGADDDWAPPGHGDVYLSLKLSGLLDQLLSRGIRWAFISNIDNLAACLEPWILGLIREHKIDFLLEVTERTAADRKGGTLVVKDGRLFLLEIAQVAPEEQDAFMDIERFRVFNTNNLWVDLASLSEALSTQSLRMPVIQNKKIATGRHVIQLEQAMGAAVSSFPNARALKVTRDRFFPTKTVEDLFVLQSDACMLDAMFQLHKNPRRPGHLPLRPQVVFGDDFLSSPLAFPARFEAPETVSLVGARRLEVRGDVYFERDITIEGDVAIIGRSENIRLKRGTILRDIVVNEPLS
uniref:UTP--glucose-1-phosphate uridylyltransferase n=1 Tax=Desulfomonile tiedjei TaxID=2358 RepID=A0A7C4ERG0_9BACT